MTVMERKAFYDRLCFVLTDYENGEASEWDLYEKLVEIQNNWDDIIFHED